MSFGFNIENVNLNSIFNFLVPEMKGIGVLKWELTFKYQEKTNLYWKVDQIGPPLHLGVKMNWFFTLHFGNCHNFAKQIWENNNILQNSFSKKVCQKKKRALNAFVQKNDCCFIVG